MIYLLIAQFLFATAAPVPPPESGVFLEELNDSFSSPLLVTAPNGDNRLFVVERGGRIKVVVSGSVRSTPYLDVTHLLPSSPGSEQGLLGLAFHPDFPSNGKFYFSYTDSSGALVVAEKVADPSANSVSATGLKQVIRIVQPAANHNGGNLLFGPDRYLYISSGDGGGSGDPSGNGQNKNTLLGAILRLNIDTDGFPGDASRNYANPADNPFVAKSGADEIWVYGLRNPWRFWIDPPTGRMYIADVGQDAREEITVLEPGSGGANLGWNRLEGTLCYPSGGSCSTTGTVLPQVEYFHGAGSASVTGGPVYRGSQIPSLYGTYFYADFIAGWVRSFEYAGAVGNHYDWTGEFDTSLVSSFGVDGHGEMYIVSLSGTIWKVRGPSAGDEMFFYRDDGLFRFYHIRPDGSLPSPFLAGNGYTAGWSSITGLDLEGDSQDEMFFYRADGLFRFYDVRPDGTLPAPLLAGNGYTAGWNSIAKVDLNGDGADEMFFYREDGLYRFYDVRADGTLGSPILTGEDYTKGWDSITAVDLNGDGADEMFFYRNDGLFRFYDVRSDGSLPTPLLAGDGYTTGWDSITAVDLDGDRQDEMFFYRDDGLFRYYHVRSDGTLPVPLLADDGYTVGWDAVTALDLD